MITARKIAETFNMVVVILTDAALASSQQPIPRPQFHETWLAPPADQSALPEGTKPYNWDPVTGLARRIIPGQPGGMHTLTGLAHDGQSHVAYDPEINQQSIHARARKLAALQKTLLPPVVFGPDSGELLVIGWGSTRGAIEETVEQLRDEGRAVSSIHLTFLQPMAPGLKQIMSRFGKVMTIEGNWCDPPDDALIDDGNRRYSALAMLLRSRTLIDVDCWCEVKGQPIKPSLIRAAILRKLATQ